MIRIEDYSAIGTLAKPHGIKGEIAFNFTIDALEESECDYIVCLMDGIPVPFFIENLRYKGESTAILKLEGVENEVQAKQFGGKTVYFPSSELPEEDDEFLWSHLAGYTLFDEKSGEVGKILEVDETTINTLFIVEYKGEELLIPANEDIIMEIDQELKRVEMQVPDGLLDFDSVDSVD